MQQDFITNFGPEEINDLKTGLLNEISRYGRLISQCSMSVKPERLGDRWVEISFSEISARLKAARHALTSDDLLFSGFRKEHPLKEKGFASFSSHKTGADTDIKKWRNSLSEKSYFALQLCGRKEAFDYYFRNDLYGEFAHDDTLILSSGAKVLPFFSPPAAVRLSLDVANRNNWFGYSDSLGHVDTRKAIAALESYRRSNPGIDEKNVAVVQGGTQGLNIILGLLKNMGVVGKFIAVIPNYAPLIDDISNHFELCPLSLSRDFRLDIQKLNHMLDEPDTRGVVLNIPHNPPLAAGIDIYDLSALAKKCADLGKYLIIDEMNFCEKQSVWYDPAIHSSTIIIHSYSKRYAIAGLKLGHVLTNRNLVNKLYRFASSSYGSPPSFLYLCATTINALELLRGTGKLDSFHDDILLSFSDVNLIKTEFDIWCGCEALIDKVTEFILSEIMAKRFYPSIKEIAKAENGSCNRNIRSNLEGMGYKSFLHVLLLKNVSLFPMECLLVPDNRHDLRVTISVDPNVLLRGLTASFEVTDNIYAKQRLPEWLNKDDLVWLSSLGFIDDDSPHNSLGHLYRVMLRLQHIVSLYEIEAPGWLYRAAALHDIGKPWASISDEEKAVKFREIFNTDMSDEVLRVKSDNIWSIHLLESGERCEFLPILPPELKAGLRKFWTMKKGPDSRFPFECLLDLADKTSDFMRDQPRSWNDLAVALKLKLRQASLRYPDSAAELEAEYMDWILNGNDFLKGLSNVLRQYSVN